MSQERVGHAPRPLLPDALEERLVGGLLKIAGFVLAGIALLGWLSLFSWSADDPSLTHATSGMARNWLGPLGAIVSDLMLQTLGFCAILVYLGLAYLGLELILKQRVTLLKLRLWLYPLAVVTLSGAMASLPAPESWPLNHGLGGMVGDTAFSLFAGVLAMINPVRAGMVAGLVMFTTGMCLLSAGLGLTQRDWAILWQREPAAAGEGSAGGAGAAGGNIVTRWLAKRVALAAKKKDAAVVAKAVPASEWSGEEALAGEPIGAVGHATAAPNAGAPVSAAHMRTGDSSRAVPMVHAPADMLADQSEPLPPPMMPARMATSRQPEHEARSPPAAAPVWHPAVPAVRAPAAQALHVDAVHRGAGFDNFTDRASRAMAARFAPGGQEAATASGGVAGGAATSARMAAAALGTLFRASEPGYRAPSLNILRRPAASRPSAEFTAPILRGSARLLEDTLNDFSIKGEVKDIRPGPVVTLFEFEPARGTKTARVVALADDIARSMSATSARVAVIPGRNAIGIELPNVRRETVLLRDVLESETWRRSDAQLPIVLGKGIGGEPVIADLARMPHLLVAGTTGSGKSVAVNAMILSLLFKHSPAECRLLMIDPKMLELSVYNGIPHLLAPVVTDPHQAAATLGWAVMEMEERYKRMAQLGVRNIDIFNNRVRNARKRGEQIGRTVQTGFDDHTGAAVYERERIDHEPMPYIVIVVDELADLMVVAGKEMEASVQRLAQMARAAGIHLIMATQRPSVDVITGTIKANLPTRIAFKVASKIDSRTILNEQGAEQLLGAGDMLFAPGAGQIVRVHGPLVSDEEVERVAEALRENGEAQYIDALMRVHETGQLGVLAAAVSRKANDSPDADELFDRAVAIVHRDQKASTSYLQRRLAIGYNRAADLMERMQREGLVSAADASGRRRVLMGAENEADDGPQT